MLPMPQAASLRSNFVWTFAGNAVYAAGQWALLSLLAKLGGSEMLGQYALAIAITAPVAMFSHLNLRAVIATDVTVRHPFGDYLTVRLGATALGLIAIALLAVIASPTRAMIPVVVAGGLAQSAENVSDAFYGALQRHERMSRIALSMMGRAVMSVAALGIALCVTGSIAAASMALAAARIAALLLFDIRTGEPLARTNRAERLTILRTALPLGLVLMLVTLNTNLPRYAIEQKLGTRELGAFAGVASFLTGGNTVVNALGQSATPRLARFFAGGDRHGFRRLTVQLTILSAGLGAAGIAGALLLGAPLLRILYRAEFAQYAGVLAAVMTAAIPVYIAGTLGYVITSVRAFDAQLPLFCAVAASCAAASWLLVPRLGLMGAPAALAIAACVQVAGELVILARAFRRAEKRA
jgi:O-antigen/teichoic acid export membrane protein